MAKSNQEAEAIQNFCNTLASGFDGELELHYDDDLEAVIINGGYESIGVYADSVKAAKIDILEGILRWLHDNSL